MPKDNLSTDPPASNHAVVRASSTISKASPKLQAALRRRILARAYAIIERLDISSQKTRQDWGSESPSTVVAPTNTDDEAKPESDDKPLLGNRGDCKSDNNGEE